jgi:hypothetical protein
MNAFVKVGNISDLLRPSLSFAAARIVGDFFADLKTFFVALCVRFMTSPPLSNNIPEHALSRSVGPIWQRRRQDCSHFQTSRQKTGILRLMFAQYGKADRFAA